jgi:uncharacterized protein (TIGR02145 family)
MKKLFTIIAAVLLTASLFAQSPEKMSYQAVVRNSSQELVVNQSIGMQISILQNSENGSAAYVERHFPATNANGLVTLEIGTGTIVSGNFTTIDWANGIYFIKTETDPTGGTNYTITGTSQLLSVPYALHAKTAETVSGGITETDPVFIAWDKSTGISVTESQISDLGTYIETETQTISDVAALDNSVNTQLKNVTNPTDAQDAATKSYVDALLERIKVLEESDILNNGFTDARDGTHYDAVKIGNQVWMAENLKYLPSVVGPATVSETTAYYYVYGYDGTDVTAAKATANYTTYGVLYNWPAAMNACPTGWHLPSDAEWTELTDYLGGSGVAGGKLKEIGTTHWNTPNTDATNETGFTALPGGDRSNGGYFGFIGNYGDWWSATEGNTTDAWGRGMNYNNCNVSRYNSIKELGFSVRCLRD